MPLHVTRFKIDLNDINPEYKQADLKNTLRVLMDIKHENIGSWVIGACETDYEEKCSYVYYARKAVNGSTIKTLSKLTNWTTRLVREVASAVLQALIYLKEHRINQCIVNINESTVLVDENGVWKIVDCPGYMNHQRIAPILTKISPLVALGELIESLGVTETEAINFIEKCKKDTSLEELIDHPFIKNLDKSIDDFVVIEPIGKGGFGEVLKVTNSKDDQLYAIKRIKIESIENYRTTLEKAAEEVKILAKLDHKYVVKYKKSWTKKMKKADYKTYKEDTYDKMNVDEASNGSTIKPYVFIKQMTMFTGTILFEFNFFQQMRGKHLCVAHPNGVLS